MTQFDHSHLKNIATGIKLFNAQKYWECHEELEFFWLEESGPIRNIYWAIIQVAVAMYHYREENMAGAEGMIIKAQEKFERCELLKLENIILEENLSWMLLKKLTREKDFKKLYEFRFKEIA